MNYCTGITAMGERLRFERWVYEAWVRRQITDRYLIAALSRCVRFVIEW